MRANVFPLALAVTFAVTPSLHSQTRERVVFDPARDEALEVRDGNLVWLEPGKTTGVLTP
ncbi:MAG: hypothetical protein ACP5NF_10580 [Thermoanaerobaculum sp.]